MRRGQSWVKFRNRLDNAFYQPTENRHSRIRQSLQGGHRPLAPLRPTPEKYSQSIPHYLYNCFQLKLTSKLLRYKMFAIMQPSNFVIKCLITYIVICIIY